MSFFIHDLHLDYACTRLAPMRRAQLVPMHILLRWVLARLAVGENLTSRGGGGTNQQCSGGVVPMHQPNGSPARYPTTVGADEPHRILEGWKIARIVFPQRAKKTCYKRTSERISITDHQ